MVKKVIKKMVQDIKEEKISEVDSKKKITNQPKFKKMTPSEREELLIENFVSLQHAMTNLSIKFGNLSDNISKLLEVYEEAARNYAISGKTDNEDMLKKINSLLDQNKTIAKGLVLMEAKLRSGNEMYNRPQQQVERVQTQFEESATKPKPKPLPSI